MIFDRIGNIGPYRSLSPAMETAVSYIMSLTPDTMPSGDFELDGRKIYGFRRDFPLKPEDQLRYESHQRYIDIQYVLEGCEEILVADTSSLSIDTPYDPEKDIAFHGGTERFTRLTLHPGDFAILFPGDAHKPCCAAEGCAQSKKLVVKVTAG